MPNSWAKFTDFSIYSFDVGDIVEQESIAIDPDISAVQLTNRLAEMGANLLVRCVSDLRYHLDRCTPQPSHGVILGICQFYV